MIPTPETLRRACDIVDEIERLQAEMAALFGSTPSAPKPRAAGRKPAAAPVAAAARGTKSRRLSPEGRARIIAAARARWARWKAAKKP